MKFLHNEGNKNTMCWDTFKGENGFFCMHVKQEQNRSLFAYILYKCIHFMKALSNLE